MIDIRSTKEMEHDKWLNESEEIKIRDEKRKILGIVTEHLRELERNIRLTKIEYNQLPNDFIHEMDVATRTCCYISLMPSIESRIKEKGYGKKLIRYNDFANRTSAEAAYFNKNPIEHTLEEIMTYGISDNGMDRTKVIRGLLIAQRIPTSYLLAFKKKPKREDESRTFTTLLKLYNENGSVIIDPSTAYPKSYAPEKESPFMIYGVEGLDNKSLGITSYKDIEKIRKEMMARK